MAATPLFEGPSRIAPLTGHVCKVSNRLPLGDKGEAVAGFIAAAQKDRQAELDSRQALPYKMAVILSFRSKALKRYWTKGDDAGIRPDWRRKVRLVLSRLDVARLPTEMDGPGFGFHALTGDQAGRFAVWISRNWRLTFSWDGENAADVDLEDYHGS